MNGPRSGSSFYLAARLLPASVRHDAVALYGFCRRVDDLADEAAEVAYARRQLDAVRDALMTRDAKMEPEVMELAERRSVPLDVLLELIDTVETDLGDVRIPDHRALMDYCYGVAGTVGVAMCAVLGANSEVAIDPAIDLGVAMQLTNIARDVLEDAERGRIYLPATWLDGQVTPAALVRGDRRARHVAHDAAVRLIELSERLYMRADHGMSHIPRASRPAIQVAARMYRAVGRRTVELGPERYWHSRARLGLGSRLAALASAAVALVRTAVPAAGIRSAPPRFARLSVSSSRPGGR